MKLIKPYFEVLEQGSDTIGIIKQIERVGRICYKSEDKITEDSHLKFVDMLINIEHGAMLEHGTVYLFLKGHLSDSAIEKYMENEYSICKYAYNSDLDWAVTTNYRVLVENNWLDDLQYQCEPTEYHEKRYSVRFVCDRGVSHELVRHRVFSFAQESTRYCNYSQDKFGGEITYIFPLWFSEGLYKAHATGGLPMMSRERVKERYKVTDEELNELSVYGEVLRVSQQNYFKLLKMGWQPQQARAVLPNSLKTEIVLTGFESDWKHFFSLRAAKTAHPQMQELAYPLKEEFEKRGFL